MNVNVEVDRSANENNGNLLRRFTKRVQGAGILPRVRGARYKERNQSPYKKKVKTLKTLEARKIREEQIKLGKIVEKTRS